MRVFNNTVCCKNHTNTNECMKLFNNMVGGEAFPNCRGKLQTRGLTKRKNFEVAYLAGSFNRSKFYKINNMSWVAKDTIQLLFKFNHQLGKCQSNLIHPPASQVKVDPRSHPS